MLSLIGLVFHDGAPLFEGHFVAAPTIEDVRPLSAELYHDEAEAGAYAGQLVL